MSAEGLIDAAGKLVQYLVKSPEEKKQDEKWHEERPKQEAAARVDARKAENDYELPLDYTPPPPPRRRDKEQERRDWLP